MPGLEDGSSLANAFTWDHTAYPGGTRVFGATTYNQSQDWWALYLLAGRTYVFQTRLPTAWSNSLYLYDANGSYLVGSSSGGDDGSPQSKITYTPQREGWYYLTIYGYYSYGYYGPYALESVPAPRSLRNFHVMPCRLSACAESLAAVPSRYDVMRDRAGTVQAARLQIFARTAINRVGRFSGRSSRQAQRASRFNNIKTPTIAVTASRLATRTPTFMSVAGRLDVRRMGIGLLPSRWNSFYPSSVAVISRHDARGHYEAVMPMRHAVLLPHGWTIHARNVQSSQRLLLGFIPDDAHPRQLVDVPLADGVWEIEAVGSQWLWDQCRSRRTITLITGDGGQPPVLGLPVIQNLRREVVASASVIRWNVAADTDPGEMEFGLWFGPSSPVDTSGPPNQTVLYYAGQGEYRITHPQSAPEIVAVTAITPTACGTVAELDLPWNVSPPASPPEQLAVGNLRGSM